MNISVGDFHVPRIHSCNDSLMNIYKSYILNRLTWLDSQSTLLTKYKCFVANDRHISSCDNQSMWWTYHRHKRTCLKIEFHDWFDCFIAVIIILIYVLEFKTTQWIFIFNEIISRFLLSFRVSFVASLSFNEFIPTE